MVEFRSVFPLALGPLLGLPACGSSETASVPAGESFGAVQQPLRLKGPEPVVIDPYAPKCGGAANLACPGKGQCLDNPYDACDPASDLDCSGLCACVLLSDQAQDQTPPVACLPLEHFDFSPHVCTCTVDEDVP
jgi:hypothetical protein